MLTERDRELPQSGAPHEIHSDLVHPALNAPRLLGEVSGAAEADALIADEERRVAALAQQSTAEEARRVAAVENLRIIGRKAWEHVLVASPQHRAAATIEKATKYLGPDANAAQVNHVANHIQGFERAAVDFLTHGDNHGLEQAIVALWNGVRDADKLATPKPPLMPPGENIFYNAGWGSEEEYGLRNILRNEGDRCTALNADGATLASGKRVSKKAALDAYTPPAGGRQVSVGSLQQVLADIRRMQS